MSLSRPNMTHRLTLPHRSTMTAPRSTRRANTKTAHTSFEGMIANSHQVLDLALSARDDNTFNHTRPTKVERAIPDILFRECEGIILLHVIEAAFVFGASLGTGLLMSHNKEKNTWSAPSAVGLTGVTWGMLGGIARKDLVVFIMDKDTMSALTGAMSFNLGGQASLTFGESGREVDATLHASNRGVGATVAFSYSRGLMVGVSLEGSVVAPRTACNQQFYGRVLRASSPREILYEMQVPDSVKGLHERLTKLAESNKKMREPILYQVAQTQTGDESEDETVPGSEPPIEKEMISTGWVTCEVAQIQTDDEEEDFVMCQSTQTQTGQDSADEEQVEPPVMIEKSTGKRNAYIEYQASETQTNNEEEDIVMYQVAQTQTGKETAEVDSLVELPIMIEKRTANTNDSTAYGVAQTQTEEQDETVMCQVAQTQTGEDCEMKVPLIQKIANTNDSGTYQVVQTQTDDAEEDAVMVSSDEEEEFVITDGSDSESDDGMMEFVVSSNEIEKEMKDSGM